MKKRIAGIFTVLTMLLMLVPAGVFAEGNLPSILMIAGQSVLDGGYWLTTEEGTLTTENASDINYHVHYDKGSNTLTLNNANITGAELSDYDSVRGIHVNGGDLEIVLADGSENTITANSDSVTEAAGIYMNGTGTLTISGTGTLNVNVSAQSCVYGIYDSQGTVSIQGGTVEVQCGGGFSYNYAVYSNTLNISGGNVTLNAEGNASYSFHGSSNNSYVNISAGSLTVNGDTAAFRGTVRATGNRGVAYTNGSSLETVLGSGNTGLLVFTNGTNGTVYGNYELTSDVKIPANAKITQFWNSTLTIPEGKTVEIPNGVVFDIDRTFTINGSLINNGTLNVEYIVENYGTLTNNGTLDVTGDGAVYNLGNGKTEGFDDAVDAVKVSLDTDNLIGADAGLDEYYVSRDGGTVKIWVSTEGMAELVPLKVTVNGVEKDVTWTKDKYGDDTCTLQIAATSSDVEIAVTGQFSNDAVIVGGTNVLMGGYWVTDESGRLSAGTADNYNVWYDAASNQLTLKNATISGSSENPAWYGAGIFADGFDLILVLEGTNTVSGAVTHYVDEENAINEYNSYAIYIDKDLYIEGTGTLIAQGSDIVAEENDAKVTSSGIYTDDDLDIYGANVIAVGGDVTGNDVKSRGIDCHEDLIVYAGSLTANGGSATGGEYAASYGIYASEQVDAKEGTFIIAAGGNAAGTEAKTYGVYSYDYIDLSGGTISAVSGNISGDKTEKYGIVVSNFDEEFENEHEGNINVVSGTLVTDSMYAEKQYGYGQDQADNYLLVIGNECEIKGNPVISGDITIPFGVTVTVPAGSTLTIAEGVTVTNNGTIVNSGAISGSGQIDNDGTISGNNPGVPVINPEVTVTGVTVSPETLSLVKGETVQLSVAVTPNDATNLTVTWISSDNGIVTVADGMVTAVAPGTATITAKAGDKSDSCTVTVTEKAEQGGDDGEENQPEIPDWYPDIPSYNPGGSSSGGNTGSGSTDTDAPETEWIRDEDGNTYFTENGEKVTGWVEQDGSWYYMDEDTGIMSEECWVKVDNAWYAFDDFGVMLTGWQQIDGKWYYLKDWGGMATGWQLIDGVWYYLRSDGSMAANAWVQTSGYWYYLTGSGAMATARWVEWKGDWYYLYSSGIMATNATIDGYYVNSNGVWVQ